MTTTVSTPVAAAARYPDVIIRASAGTGKTFQLSNRFLGQLHAGAPCDQILATTFTRKAAGEILERVLVRLAEAASDGRKGADLSAFVGDRALNRARCLELLEQLTQNLHRVRVSTLDSFFLQIASSFTLELGLSPGWQITDDFHDAQLRARAIDAILQQDSAHDILRLMNLLTKGEAERSVSELVQATVSDLYRVFQETKSEAWKRFPRPPLFSAEELARTLDRLHSMPLPADSRIEKARLAEWEAATAGDWEEFVRKGLPAKIQAGENSYYGKTLDPPVVDVYQQLLRHSRAVILDQLARQTEATHDLLSRFHVEYERLKHEARAMRFEDVTRELAKESLTGGLERMAFRLDAAISHLLLDEFQDTSLAQWQVLRPFAQHVASGGDRESSFFCVGDVKQAIYGWRGGIAQIFEALQGQLKGLSQASLNRSFRSSQPVIDTVNKIFTTLSSHPNLEDLEPAVRRWTSQFDRHTTARESLPGYTCLITAPLHDSAAGEKPLDATLRYAAERIAEIVKQAPGRSVGVLTRRNKVVAKLIFELRRLGIPASEEGGNPLTDSAAVQLLMSLFELADFSGHTVARYHLAHSPLGPILGLSDHEDEPAAKRAAQQIRRDLLVDGYGPTVARWARTLGPTCSRRDWSRLEQLVELAYGFQANATLRTRDFVRYVAGEKVSDPTADDVRVMTIHQAKGLQFDVVVLPDLEGSLIGQPDPFVVGHASPTEPIDRVCLYRNASIQALLPEDIQQLFTAATDQAVSEALCVLYVAVTRAVHALHMIVAPSTPSEQHLYKTFSGLLRAALTDGQPLRPSSLAYEHGNPMWFAAMVPVGAASRAAPAPSPARLAGPTGDVTFTPASESESPKAVSWRVDPPAVSKPGVSPVVSSTAVVSNAKNAGEPSPLPLSPIHIRLAKMSERSRGLARATPSGKEGGNKVKLSNVLRLGNAAAMDRGTLIHAWFEQIDWLDEGWPDEKTLRQVAERIGAANLDIGRLVGQFHAMLRAPKISWTLFRKSYQPPHGLNLSPEVIADVGSQPIRFEVHNERRFAIREASTVLSGSIDRLVLMYHDYKLVAADIIDFKTDSISREDPAALAGKVEYYRGQLEAYRPAVAKIYRLPLERISARLLMVGVGLVQNV